MQEPRTTLAVNCEIGEVTEVPLTPDELDALAVTAQSAADAQARAEQQRVDDEARLAVVNARAADDPAFAALAELLLRARG